MDSRRKGPGILALLVALPLAACVSDGPSGRPMAFTDGPAPAERRAESWAPQAGNATVAMSTENAKAATTQDALTLEGAVGRAVSWHPAIDEAVGRLNQSTAEIEVARSGYLPKVTGGIDSGYNSADRDGWRPRMNVLASQMVYDFGKVSSAVDARVAGENMSRAGLLLAVDTLIRDTAHAVVELQRYRALRVVAADQVEGVRTIADLVRERSLKGASTKSDEIQAAARVEAARSTLLQIESEVARWENVVAAFIGANGTLSVSAGAPDWLMRACSAAADLDWSRVPAMMQAEARRAEAAAMLGQSRAQALPTVSLEAGAGYDLNGFFSDSDTDNPGFNVGVNVSSTLYEGGAAGARRVAATHALGAADAARDNARFQVTRNLMEARGQLGDLSRLQASLASRSDMMAQTRDLYRQQYFELGTRTLLDLLNSEQELHSAQFDTVNTAHDIRRLNIDCLFNAGQARKAFDLGGKTVRGIALDT